MRLFNRTGRHYVVVFLWVVFAVSAHGHPGDGLVMDAEGTLYFGWIDPPLGPGHHACVWKLDPEGHASPLFTSQHSYPGAQSSNIFIILGLDGHLYCSERQYLGDPEGYDKFVTDLWRIDPDGKKIRVLGPEPGRSPLGGPACVVDRHGAIIYARDGHVLHKRNLDGRTSILAGGALGHRDAKGVDAQFEDISAMAWGPDDVLYVYDKGTIRLVSPDGTVTTLDTGFVTFEEDIPPVLRQTHFFGMTVDDKGNVFGADWGKRRVVMVSSKGEISTLYRCEPPWRPEGIVWKDDVLYILEMTGPDVPAIKPRVRKRTPNGTMTTLFELSE